MNRTEALDLYSIYIIYNFMHCTSVRMISWSMIRVTSWTSSSTAVPNKVAQEELNFHNTSKTACMHKPNFQKMQNCTGCDSKY